MPNTRPLWQLLYNYDADVVLSGHDHIYERFAPQDASGALDNSRGLREFIVGTGGANHTVISAVAANSQVRNTDTFGILELTLHQAGYAWHFEPESGKTFSDSGSDTCHGADTVPPSAPTNFVATSVGYNQVDLSWTASTDNVGVAGYKVYRNGKRIATAKSVSYTDKTVHADTKYSYYVTAYDAAGLNSDPSNSSSVTTPVVPTPTFTPSPTPSVTPARHVTTLFFDGFEYGNLSKWSASRGLVVQNQVVASGNFAAREPVRRAVPPSPGGISLRRKWISIIRSSSTI